MWKRLCAVLLLCLLVNVASAEDPVYFADETLKTAVEDALWVWDPTPMDMLGLTSLTVGSEQIGSVVGLEYATNLTTLELPVNWITDISPLASLANLNRLVLNNNGISDLTPLAGLTQLEHIDMHDNCIGDLTPLAGLSQLRKLVLRRNRLRDLTPLAGLPEIEALHFEANDISDISPLAALTNLTLVDLCDNPLNNDAYSVYIPQIIANNPDVELTYSGMLCQFILRSTTGGSIVTPGEGRFDFAGTSSIRIEARADPGFAFSSFEGTMCTTQNPTSVPLDQDHNIVARFVSLSDTLYVDDDAPEDPGPADLSDGDPLEAGTLDHPFDSIQEAIEVAREGASVIVRPGLYRETLAFTGKAIKVLGIDPNDPNAGSFPILDAGQEDTAVSFTRSEDPNCLLRGFVITRGKGRRAGAILCSHSSPTVAHCLIAGNRSTTTEGAAVYCTDSEAVFVNCTIADNVSDESGAGLRTIDSHVTIANSILWANLPCQIISDDPNGPSVSYTDIEGGWPGEGNIEGDPQFAEAGSWVDEHSNLATEPEARGAVFVLGDYHLKSESGRWDPETDQWVVDDVTSPCIDTGDPLYPIGREPPPNGQIVNMGAYGGTAEASLEQ